MPQWRKRQLLCFKWTVLALVLLFMATGAQWTEAKPSPRNSTHTHATNASTTPSSSSASNNSSCLHSNTHSLKKLYAPLFKQYGQNMQEAFDEDDVFLLATTTSDEEMAPERPEVPRNQSHPVQRSTSRVVQPEGDGKPSNPTAGGDNASAVEEGQNRASRFNATFNKKLDKDHFEPIRVRFDLSALFDTDKFCATPYERRAHGLDDMDSGDSTVLCRPEDVLTKEKRDYLLNRVLPRVTHLMESLLKVYRYRSPLTFREDICGDLFSKYPKDIQMKKRGDGADDDAPGQADKKTNKKLKRETMADSGPAMRSSSNTDLLIFAMAVPAPENDNRTVAWSGLCGVDKSTHRPTVARVNFVPRHIFPTSASSFYNIFLTTYASNDEAQRRIRFVQANDGHFPNDEGEDGNDGIFSFFRWWGSRRAGGTCPSLKTGPRDDAFSLWTEQYTNSIKHELFHVLGFNPLYLKARSVKRDMTEQSLASVDAYKTTYRVVTEPHVVDVARRYFNCSHVAGVPLEDEGGDGTASTHWERRVLKDELMAGVLTPLTSVLSPFTLLFLDSLPFYRVNVASVLAAESTAVPSHEVEMQWGRGAGCDLLNVTTCVADQTGRRPGPSSSAVEASPSPSLYWCASSPSLQCSQDRTSFGMCSGVRHGGALLMDRCPIVEAHPLGSCVLPSPSVATTYPLEEADGMLPARDTGDRVSLLYHGNDARCFMTGDVRAAALPVPRRDPCQGKRENCTVTAAAPAYPLSAKAPPPDRVSCIRTRCVPRRAASTSSSRSAQHSTVMWSLQVQVGGVWLPCPADGSAGAVALQPNETGMTGYVFCDAASVLCTPKSSHLFYFGEPAIAPLRNAKKHDTPAPEAGPTGSASDEPAEESKSFVKAATLGEEHAFYVATMEAVLLIEAEHATEKVDTSLFQRCKEQVSLAVEKDLLLYLRYASPLFAKDGPRLSSGGGASAGIGGTDCHIAVEKVHVLSLSYVPLVDPSRPSSRKSSRDDTSTFVTITASVVLRSTCRSVSNVRSALFVAQKAMQRDAKRNATYRRRHGGRVHRGHEEDTAGLFAFTYALWADTNEYCRFAGTTVSTLSQMVVNFVPQSLLDEFSDNNTDPDRMNETAALTASVALRNQPSSSSLSLYGNPQINTDTLTVVDRVRSNVALLSAPVTSHLVAVADVHTAFYLHYTVLAPDNDEALYEKVQQRLGLPTGRGGSGGKHRPKGEKRRIPLLSCPSLFFKKSFLGDVSTLLGIHRTWMDVRQLSLFAVPRRHGERNTTHHHVTFFVRANVTLYLSRHTLVGLQTFHEMKGVTTDDVLHALRARWKDKLLFSQHPEAGGKLTGAPAYAYLTENIALRYLTAAGRVLHVANCTTGIEEVRLLVPHPTPEGSQHDPAVTAVLDRAWPPHRFAHWSRRAVFVGWFALLTSVTLLFAFMVWSAVH